MAKYSRRLSSNERLLLVANYQCPPVVNQFILFGKGKLDLQKWQNAVREASMANPGLNVVLKGWLGRARWIDKGVYPRVIEVDGSLWDKRTPEGAPFLNNLLDPHKGPVCEVVLINGETPHVIFRSLHAAVDGMGQITWMEDIFRCLNDMEPIGSTSAITDYELAKSFNKGHRTAFPSEHIAPTGLAQGDEHGVTWKRVILKGRYRNILARVAVEIAKEARRNGDGIVRLGIPVDLRRHEKGLRSTANLAFSIIIEITPETTPESVAEDIDRQLKEYNECKLFKGDELYRFIPLWLMNKQGKKILCRKHEKGQYNISAYISNMGRIPIHLFQGAGFKSEGIFGVPPYFETMPFFIGLASYKNNNEEFTQELILTMPKVLASNGRMDRALDNIIEGLNETQG